MIESRKAHAAELPAVRFRAIAVGGVALRAVATGALAAGAAAIGALAVAPSPSDVSGWATHQRRSSAVGRLEVDELVIGGRSVSAEDIGPVPGSALTAALQSANGRHRAEHRSELQPEAHGGMRQDEPRRTQAGRTTPLCGWCGQWQGAGTESVRTWLPEFPFDAARRGYAAGPPLSARSCLSTPDQLRSYRSNSAMPSHARWLPAALICVRHRGSKCFAGQPTHRSER